LGHAYGSWTKLNSNQHQKVCEHDKSHVIKENHKWDAGEVTKKATEKQAGTKTYTCTVCKATKTETIHKLKPSAPKISGTPLAKMSAGKTSITMAWNKIQGADGYDIFFAQCNHHGKKIVCKNVESIKGNKTFKWTKSGLKKGTAYKFVVAAFKTVNGKQQVIAKSKAVYVSTSGGKATNVKKVTAKYKNKAVKKLTLKVKKKATLKTSVTLQSKKLKLPTYRKVKFETSNKKIATVNSKGKITAKKKGTCYIYVYTQSGVYTKVKVTVK
jgi:hypothetical protein